MNIDKSRKIQLIRKAFGSSVLDRREENIAIWCPNCNSDDKDKKKLIIKVEDGWYHCWVCLTNGKNINYLVSKHAKEFKKQFLELYASSSNFHSDFQEDEVKEKPKLPDDVLLVVENKKNIFCKPLYSYLISRGLSNLDMYRWKICGSNQFPFKRKVIIPSYDAEGILNFYTARDIEETQFKYKNADVKRTDIIFNEFDVDWKEPIILVEGVFDALKCPSNTIPILGSSLPKKSLLYKKLTENKSTIVVALDNDAEIKSHSICKSLSLGGCNVYNVKIDGDRDFGDMSKQEAKESLKNLKKWKQDDFIIAKIQNMKSGSII